MIPAPGPEVTSKSASSWWEPETRRRYDSSLLSACEHAAVVPVAVLHQLSLSPVVSTWRPAGGEEGLLRRPGRHREQPAAARRRDPAMGHVVSEGVQGGGRSPE